MNGHFSTDINEEEQQAGFVQEVTANPFGGTVGQSRTITVVVRVIGDAVRLVKIDHGRYLLQRHGRLSNTPDAPAKWCAWGGPKTLCAAKAVELAEKGRFVEEDGPEQSVPFDLVDPD